MAAKVAAFHEFRQPDEDACFATHLNKIGQLASPDRAGLARRAMACPPLPFLWLRNGASGLRVRHDFPSCCGGGSVPAPAPRMSVGRRARSCRRTAEPTTRAVLVARQRADLPETAGRSCGPVPSSVRSRGRRHRRVCTGPRRVSPRHAHLRPRRRRRGPTGTTAPRPRTTPRSRPPNVGRFPRTRSDFKATSARTARRSTTTTRDRLLELVPGPKWRRRSQTGVRAQPSRIRRWPRLPSAAGDRRHP